MKYTIRNGVIREMICGQNILISTLEARKICPYLTQLNESSVFIWKMLEEGINTEQMTEKIIQEYDISEKEAQKGLELFLSNMEEQHFIIKESADE